MRGGCAFAGVFFCVHRAHCGHRRVKVWLPGLLLPPRRHQHGRERRWGGPPASDVRISTAVAKQHTGARIQGERGQGGARRARPGLPRALGRGQARPVACLMTVSSPRCPCAGCVWQRVVPAAALSKEGAKGLDLVAQQQPSSTDNRQAWPSVTGAHGCAQAPGGAMAHTLPASKLLLNPRMPSVITASTRAAETPRAHSPSFLLELIELQRHFTCAKERERLPLTSAASLLSALRRIGLQAGSPRPCGASGTAL